MKASDADYIGYPYQRYQRASLPHRTTQVVVAAEEEDAADEAITEVPVTPRYGRSPRDEMRSPTSALRYSRQPYTAKETIDFQRQPKRPHWFVYVVIGVLVMLIG